MLLKKLLKTCCAACLTMAVGSAFADDAPWGVQDSFESTGAFPIDLPTHWSGNAVITNATVAAYPQSAPSYGQPIPSASHTKVLQVEGKAICTNTSAATSINTTQVDFMVKVTAPDEAPDVASDTEGAQIALAAWTNEVAALETTVPLKLYCTLRSDSTKKDWVVLTNAVETGTWVRISMNFDYTQKVCRVSMNGEPLVTAEGYRTNMKPTDNGTADNAKGSWYSLANDPASGIGNRVSEVKVIGTTFVDDLVITNASMETYNPYVDGSGNPIKETITPSGSGKTAVDVPLNVIDKSGLTKQEIADGKAAPGDTLSVMDTVEAGLEVGKNQKFEMKTITPGEQVGSDAAKTQTFTITFPGANDASYYTVTATADEAGKGTNLISAPGADEGITTEGSGKKWKGTVNVGNNKTIYFHLQAKQPTSN